MEAQPEAPTLITSRQAAEVLGCSLSHLHRKVAAGLLAPRLRGTGLRGQLWFDAADVEALRQRSQESGA